MKIDIETLKRIVGENNVSDDIADLYVYSSDASVHQALPSVIVRPKTIEEIQKIMRFANKEKIPIYIHGTGTAFKGSPRPKRPGSIILSTHGLTSIKMQENDMYFEVGAGVNQYELEKYLLSSGYMLPMNIGSKYAATMGGAVAVNTIGHMVDICLGKIIDYVMGVEVVLPNGEIIEVNFGVLFDGNNVKIDDQNQTIELENYKTFDSPFVNSDWNSGYVVISKDELQCTLDFRNSDNPIKSWEIDGEVYVIPEFQTRMLISILLILPIIMVLGKKHLKF